MSRAERDACRAGTVTGENRTEQVWERSLWVTDSGSYRPETHTTQRSTGRISARQMPVLLLAQSPVSSNASQLLFCTIGT